MTQSGARPSERGRTTWLASHPKSSDPWLRAILERVVRQEQPFDLNALGETAPAFSGLTEQFIGKHGTEVPLAAPATSPASPRWGHDGYRSVGDMARRDEDGFLYLVDRKGNVIISGGENVYPSEVEAVLGAHPAVREAAVIGLPEAKWGERVHAVVAFGSDTTATAEDLIEWCKTRLASYKRPRSISIVSAEKMPRTATGKIQHRLLNQGILEREQGR